MAELSPYTAAGLASIRALSDSELAMVLDCHERECEKPIRGAYWSGVAAAESARRVAMNQALKTEIARRWRQTISGGSHVSHG